MRVPFRRDDPDRISRLGLETDVVTNALREGARQALLRHKKLGQSIVGSRDGKIVVIPAEEIEVSEEPIDHVPEYLD